ncbi:hypothetical protein C0995_016190, partial [Termitomyces sp. Mi166
MEQVRYAPQVGSSQEMSGQQPQIGHKSLASGLVDQPAQESSDKEENNRSELTLSVQLKLVLNHFPAVTKESTQKRLQLYVVKHMQMLANMGQRVPEAEESQQDFERCQNAVRRQATSSGVPLRALSDVETTTSKVVDEEELEILQLPQMPRQHIMIKEEVLE